MDGLRTLAEPLGAGGGAPCQRRGPAGCFEQEAYERAGGCPTRRRPSRARRPASGAPRSAWRQVDLPSRRADERHRPRHAQPSITTCPGRTVSRRWTACERSASRSPSTRPAQMAEPRVTVVGRGGLLSEAIRPLDCGNSGTTMRLMAGLLAGQPIFSVMTGDASLSSRPMARVVEPLRLMGAKITGRAWRPTGPDRHRRRQPDGHRVHVARRQRPGQVVRAAGGRPDRGRDHRALAGRLARPHRAAADGPGREDRGERRRYRRWRSTAARA